MNPNDGDDTSLRGFLAIFDLAQILKLMWISFQTRYVDVDVPVVCSQSVALVYWDAPLETTESLRNRLISNMQSISMYFLTLKWFVGFDLLLMLSSLIVGDL
jgi:hypothetical protein